jgi:hypothetical protein
MDGRMRIAAHVFGQTGQDLREITPAEPIGVLLDHCLLLCHTATSNGSTIAERQTHRQTKPLSSSGVTRVWRYVKSEPLTHSWLVVLLMTTIVQRSIPAHRLDALLQKQTCTTWAPIPSGR